MNAQPTCSQIHRRVARQLCEAGIENAAREARWIGEEWVADFAKRLLDRDDAPVDDEALARIEDAASRRAKGVPLQYVLGTVEFCGVELAVGPGVLIPRAETECLVEQVLRGPHTPGPVLDLCCGSGAIGLALAANEPARRVVATDASPVAVDCARRNAARLGLGVDVRHGDLFEPVAGLRFAIVATNPPYVSDAEYADLDPSVRDHEPEHALRAGREGLDFVRAIAEQAPEHLLPEGRVYCEIGDTQGESAAGCFRAAGFRSVRVLPDWAGRDRIVVARNPNACAEGEFEHE